MATYVSRPRWGSRARDLAGTRAATALGLAGLAAVSLVLRTPHFGAGFWIDEGLSVGIASHPLAEIPGLLRQDGSPPLYYALLHGWMELAGRSEEAVRALSLLAALAAIPLAAWAAAPFGRRAAGLAAAGAALNPFLTAYAQEGRMYALVVLLGLVVCGAFARTFVLGTRRHAIVLALALAALLYTHNWGLFAAGAAGAAWLVLLTGEGDRRRLAVHGAIAFGGAAALYAPWLPTLVYQAQHTGAPWADVPGLEALLWAPARLLGGDGAMMALAFGAGTGLAMLARRPGRAREIALSLAIVAGVTLVAAWLVSQVSPAWAVRYLAVALPPLLLLGAAGLATALGAGSRVALVALALVAVMWTTAAVPSSKSNVKIVTRDVAPLLQRGDLVISTQPEQVPVLSYYLPDGLRWATPLGPVRDVGVTDWRDGVARLERASVQRDLAPLVDRLRPGAQVLLVEPIVYEDERWDAPWTSRVRRRSAEWSLALRADPRLHPTAVVPPVDLPVKPNPVRATLFRKGLR